MANWFLCILYVILISSVLLGQEADMGVTFSIPAGYYSSQQSLTLSSSITKRFITQLMVPCQLGDRISTRYHWLLTQRWFLEQLHTQILADRK